MAKRIAVLVLIVSATIATIGAVRAQSPDDEKRPLMINEVRSWCFPSDDLESSPCDLATYSELADGSLRVLFNPIPRVEGGQCVQVLSIPEDVQGWAWVGYPRKVIPVSEIQDGDSICELIIYR